jgi:opacity protein-like surface antigen
MKKFILLVLIAAAISSNMYAQDVKSESSKQFMQITTVESVVAGGLGRSKMIITNPDGSQKESDLENLFSMMGINFKNIKDNEGQLVRVLKDYTNAGWKLEQITSLTLSQNDSGAGGIFMTRYLLSKPDEKRGF